MSALTKTDLPDLDLVNRGKVRDIYAVDGGLLLVASDRLSAFDVIMNQGIPDKGKTLTQVSLFWFDFFKDVIGNHMLGSTLEQMPAACQPFRQQLEGRTMYVKKADIFPVECVARGYLIGSGWKDYQRSGAVCGHRLPPGMEQAQKLDEVIFTPATKAEIGEHDENIDFEQAASIIGRETAERLRELTLTLYSAAAAHAAKRGIIIADTKFEFGLYEGEIILCDEVLTPDSSRFWDAETYRVGSSPESFDKQIVRDWLEEQPWNKSPPPPTIPERIIENTAARYREVVRRLTA